MSESTGTPATACCTTAPTETTPATVAAGPCCGTAQAAEAAAACCDPAAKTDAVAAGTVTAGAGCC